MIALAVSLTAGYSAVLRPSLLAPAVGGGVLAALVFLDSTALVSVLLVVRNVSDAMADRSLFGGLNVGALLGILIVAVALFRVIPRSDARGLAPALGLSALAASWFFVGFVNFGGEQSLIRELVRVLSIAAITLIVLNAVDIREATSVAGAVVLAGSVPAVVALMQLAQGKGFAGTNRVYGTLGHPNSASALFSLCLAIALWKLVEEGRSLRYMAASLVFAVALIGTGALGGMARMLVTLLVYGLLVGQHSARGRRFVVIAFVIAAAFSLSPLGRDRLSSLQSSTNFNPTYQKQLPNSLDWRFLQWSAELKVWRDKPYFGYGLGSTQELVTPNGFLPHSDPVRLLVETGAVGLIIFGGLYVAFLKKLWSVYRSGQGNRKYSALVLAIIVGLTVHSLADNIFDQTAAIYAAAVLVASVMASRFQAPAPGQTHGTT